MLYSFSASLRDTWFVETFHKEIPNSLGYHNQDVYNLFTKKMYICIHNMQHNKKYHALNSYNVLRFDRYEVIDTYVVRIVYHEYDAEPFPT